MKATSGCDVWAIIQCLFKVTTWIVKPVGLQAMPCTRFTRRRASRCLTCANATSKCNRWQLMLKRRQRLKLRLLRGFQDTLVLQQEVNAIFKLQRFLNLNNFFWQISQQLPVSGSMTCAAFASSGWVSSKAGVPITRVNPSKTRRAGSRFTSTVPCSYSTKSYTTCPLMDANKNPFKIHRN